MTLIILNFRAVALGLTAEDMMMVQNFQEELKQKKKEGDMSTTAAEIKSAVQKEEYHLRVIISVLPIYIG